MKVLFLSSWYPFPANNGSKIRIYNLLRGLAEVHEVTLISFYDPSDGAADVTGLNSFCERVILVPATVYNPRTLQSKSGYFSRVPRSILNTYSQEMEERIRNTLANENINLIVASQLGTACYYRSFSGVPAIFEEAEVGVLYPSDSGSMTGWHRFRENLTWLKHKHYLAEVLEHFHACTVVSRREAKLISSIGADEQDIIVLPNGVRMSYYHNVKRVPLKSNLIYTGSFRYFANHDAMVWFLQEVFPLIKEQVPEVFLTITGDHCDLSLPASENVHLTGYVDDIRPLIASATVSIVPLRIGGGSRLKILEAMAMKTPVVSTSKGVEGIDAEDGEHILIADTQQEFATAVIRLMSDEYLRCRIVEKASQLVQEKYEVGIIVPQFLELVEKISH